MKLMNTHTHTTTTTTTTTATNIRNYMWAHTKVSLIASVKQKVQYATIDTAHMRGIDKERVATESHAQREQSHMQLRQ
jgi:hypothetical protein